MTEATTLLVSVNEDHVVCARIIKSSTLVYQASISWSLERSYIILEAVNLIF